MNMKTSDSVVSVPGRFLTPDDPHCYCSLAKDYLNASAILNTNFKNAPQWPTFSCTCQSLELFLKAFLRVQGISADDLKWKFGHDLRLLFDKARELGLSFDSIDKLGKFIPLINQAHKDRDFQYEKIGERELPFSNDLISLVKELGQRLDY